MRFYAGRFSLNKIFCAALILMLMVSMYCGMPAKTAYAAGASSPDDSKSGDSSISVTLKDEDGNTIKSGELTLYFVATLSDVKDTSNYTYTYTNEFKDVPGNSITSGDLDDPETLAAILAGYIEDNKITGTTVKNVTGTVTFDNLEFGLYLIAQTEDAEDYESAKPFIVTLPMYEEGSWVYEVDASPKVGVLAGTSSGTTETTETTETTTETSGVTTETSGTDLSDGDGTASGVNTSGGTGSTGTTIATGGTYKSETKLPQTGQLFWPIPVLLICGGILFIVGAVMVFIDRRKTKHCEI